MVTVGLEFTKMAPSDCLFRHLCDVGLEAQCYSGSPSVVPHLLIKSGNVQQGAW